MAAQNNLEAHAYSGRELTRPGRSAASTASPLRARLQSPAYCEIGRQRLGTVSLLVGRRQGQIDGAEGRQEERIRNEETAAEPVPPLRETRRGC